MKGMPITRDEAEQAIRKVAENTRNENPDFTPEQVEAAVKVKLSGYPPQWVTETLQEASNA